LTLQQVPEAMVAMEPIRCCLKSIKNISINISANQITAFNENGNLFCQNRPKMLVQTFTLPTVKMSTSILPTSKSPVNQSKP
jgi:hypothetical protein